MFNAALPIGRGKRARWGPSRARQFVTEPQGGKRVSRPIKYSPTITEDRDWGKTQVAGHRIRLWVNLATGRVVVQTDEPEPKDVGVAVDLDSPIQPSRIFINTQQVQWAGDLREELLKAATEQFNFVSAAGWDSPAA